MADARCTDKPISPLRQRMIDDMRARRFSEDTQRDYVRKPGALRPAAGACLGVQGQPFSLRSAFNPSQDAQTGF